MRALLFLRMPRAGVSPELDKSRELPLPLREYVWQTSRFLTFRPFRPDLKAHYVTWQMWGFAWTWLAGVGRYWDHPRAQWWQTAGLGSLAYVLILSIVLWLVIAPLRPRAGSWREVLLFVTLTSPPALLYAIPVERFLPMAQAAQANAWFLAIVAAWRVALWVVFLRRAARLQSGEVLIVTLLPLTAIVTTLASLNLEHVVFSIMSGIREQQVSSADTAYGIVVGLTLVSWLILPFTVISYAYYVYRAWVNHRRADGSVEPPEYVPPHRR